MRKMELVAMAGPAELVDADADQAFEPAFVEVIGDDAFDDLADRAPAHAKQPRDRRLGHLLRRQRDDVFQVRVWYAPSRAHGTGSMRTPQSRQRSRRGSHSMLQRFAPRSRCRQRLSRRSWICSWRPV